MISVPWQYGQCRTCMIMTSLAWGEWCSDSRTPEEDSRPTPLKHLPLAFRLYGGGQCGGFHPVVSGVPACGIPAGALVPGQRGAHGWLRQHDQEHADLVPWGTAWQLPPPRD